MSNQDQPQKPEQPLPLSLTSIRIGSSQPMVLAEFYEKFFDRPADYENGPFRLWLGRGCQFRVSDHSELDGPNKEPGRILLNFDTTAVKEEFERLKALGVTIIKEPYEFAGGWIASLADPDGNIVQLQTPQEIPSTRRDK